RLRQVDYDGTTAYSELQSVRINPASSSGLSVFPNPAMEQINVSFSENDSGTQIRLIDQAGRVVLTKGISAQTLRTDLLVGDLPRGVYWLRFTGDQAPADRKIILQ
ncbi:MAG: T9SS type A sorting domain-containing protein, partial [Bacteroidota bacterium]